MKIYKAEYNRVGLDMQGCLVFTNNDVGINVEYKDGPPYFELKNAFVIGPGNRSLKARIKNCIRLYKFLKQGAKRK
ncbi:hypothetical protein D3C71_234580 [compost metagenome]